MIIKSLNFWCLIMLNCVLKDSVASTSRLLHNAVLSIKVLLTTTDQIYCATAGGKLHAGTSQKSMLQQITSQLISRALSGIVQSLSNLFHPCKTLSVPIKPVQ